MGKLTEIFKYVRDNDVKAINKSINDAGRKHHAAYMTNMMFSDDVNMNYQLLSEIQNAINSFYRVVSENYLMREDARNTLENQCQSTAVLKQNFKILTDEQIFELVYQQAMEYYFKIEVTNESCFISYFEEAVQYRIISNFLRSDVERILRKMYEDIEIVVEDTRNIDFLMRNYKKIDRFHNLYHFISERLAENIHNEISKESKFDEQYFITVRKISFVLQQNFYGG